MLDIKDSIRTVWQDHGKYKSNGTLIRYKLYIFKCKNCSNEIRSRKCYFKDHSGQCQSCTAKRTIQFCHLVNRLRPFEAKYNIFKSKCPETDLEYEDYLEFTKIPVCNYCEKRMPWEPYGENNPGFWLDRKSCEFGHIKGNLVVCCGNCNFTKTNRFSYEEFMKLSPILKEIRINREVNDCPSGVCGL